ncbi:sodium-dependent transporter [Sulfurimonas sp. HSL-3221]|uniref:sodium-dependent transporter n=1 Tax=Thiomicrolovo sulfuroxydans TaxID=2894755 RepID=UPI001E5C1239|nr:sodium-dependent transporter [Sulfurimonas sp. HSL-3221]UFS62673.1 sodium-dependent transporter [Sulfurimonas sp. HSL-3221]
MKIARFSRIGFILAAAGSAVGLGNIWKFPYITGEYGGGAFVMVYLFTVMLIGFSVMIAELLIGYLSRRDTLTAFEELAPRHKAAWKWGGFMAFTGLLIMTFYSVVIGWIFNYIFVSLGNLPSSPEEAAGLFKTMLGSDLKTQIFYHTLAFLIITVIVIRGIKGGIEKLNLVLMPMLFLIVGGMFLYATTQAGFTQAWKFMFSADWSKLNSEAFVTAVGHAFFTLSLGMGSLLTYSASLPKESSLVKSALVVVALDTGIALLAGLMLFTFLYQYGAEPSAGPGLVFISLPAVFYEMGTLGNVFAVLFFISLAFAGLTSAVSLVEPMVQLAIDRFGWSRFKASATMGLFFYLVGIVVIYSGSSDYGALLTWGGKNLFDWIDYVTAAILLPTGGLVMAIFIGYVIEPNRVEAAVKHQLGFAYGIWHFSLRYVAPVALVIVMLNMMGILKLN